MGPEVSLLVHSININLYANSEEDGEVIMFLGYVPAYPPASRNAITAWRHVVLDPITPRKIVFIRNREAIWNKFVNYTK